MYKFLSLFTVLFALLFIAPFSSSADQISEELALLKAKVAEIEELQATIARRTGLGALVRPAAVPFADGHIIGDIDAPLVIMEFTDLECPFCAKFHQEVYPVIKKNLIDTGKVVFVGRDMPLINSHKQAGYAAVALRCAAQQDKYDEAKSYLFENMSKLVPEKVIAQMVKFGADKDGFNTCMEDTNLHAAVQASYQFGMELGLASTPSFLIGYNDNGKVKDFKVVAGAGTFEQFEELINQLQPK